MPRRIQGTRQPDSRAECAKCASNAIYMTENDAVVCGGCGAICQYGAVTMRHFTDGQLFGQVRAVLADDPQDKVLVFACNWCSYAGGDMAGIARIQYPASNRMVRTMCSARVSEEMVLEAFRCGAPVVLASGCHYADCHYINANQTTIKRFQFWQRKFERKGVIPERLQLQWISASEGEKVRTVINEMVEQVRELGPLVLTARAARSPWASR